VVLDALRGYYETTNANPHRGAYRLSAAATDAYAAARARVARFCGLADADCLLFVRGTTEAMNLVAASWGRANVGPGDEVVVTAMDHHAAFVTWQQLARERGAAFRIAELTADGRVDEDHLASLLSERTRVVAFPHVSNALGTVNPVERLAALARSAPAAARSWCATGRRGCRTCRCASTRSASTSTRSAGTRWAGRWGSGRCSGGARCSRRCRRGSSAAT
jgi:cysteine desulfurase/selenocysteine lyase